jgi:hypothetical protein
MSKSTYIFESKEWVLTGRDAEKTLRSGKKRTVVEIKPVYVTDPDDNSQNKWVMMDALFYVSGDD